MSTRRKYSREEDEAIFRAVKDSTTSLKASFVSVALQLGRSPQGVANRWYTALSNPEHPNYMGTAMILMKEHRAGINRTNTEKFPIETQVSIWGRILRFLHLC